MDKLGEDAIREWVSVAPNGEAEEVLSGALNVVYIAVFRQPVAKSTISLSLSLSLSHTHLQPIWDLSTDNKERVIFL